MKVELIDCTGMGSSDPSTFAARLLIYTKSTRLEQGGDMMENILRMGDEKVAEELSYIANTVRSSWEFVDYTFQITGVTRAFTHQLVRTRTASFAQQSQRSIGMEGFDSIKPEPIEIADNGENLGSEFGGFSLWDHAMETISKAYSFYSGKGISPQDARGLLPTNVSTNIIAKFNLRTFADLVGKRDNARAQGEYTDVVRAMVKEAEEVHPWIHEFLYPERLETPELDGLLRELLGDSSPVDKPRLNKALKEIDKLKGVWG